MNERQENNNQENKKTQGSYYHPQSYPSTYPQYSYRQSGQMNQQGQMQPQQQMQMYPQQSQMPQQQMQMYPQQSQMPQQQMQMYPQQSQMPQQQMQMYPQQSQMSPQQMQQFQTDMSPGMLPMQQSYIENILRLNQGEMATVYATFETNEQVSFRGRIEAAGRDHVILSEPNTGRRILLLMVYLDYVTFDGEINYSYPFGS